MANNKILVKGRKVKTEKVKIDNEHQKDTVCVEKDNIAKEKVDILNMNKVYNTAKIENELIDKTQKDDNVINILSTKTIKYIYHLADIHIKRIDKFDEYKKLFDNIKNKILEYKKKNSVIVLV